MSCPLSQTAQFGIFDDTDEDRVPGGAHADSLSDWILLSEEVTGRGLVDDRDFGGALVILKREFPSAQQWHAERLEEARAGWHIEDVKVACR
jgi:hypothetical protein